MIEPKLVHWVGTAPSTTTMQLGLVPQCPPVPTRQHVYAAAQAAQAQVPAKPAVPASRLPVAYPYATEGELRAGLGLIDERVVRWTGDPDGEHATAAVFVPEQLGYIDPSETIEANSLQIRLPGTTVVKFDGGSGLGYITDEVVRQVGFGVTPNDDDLARGRGACYTPVNYGWVYGKRPDGTPYYRSALGNPAALALRGEPEDVQALVKIQNRQFWLQVASTAAISALAVLAVIKAIKHGS